MRDRAPLELSDYPEIFPVTMHAGGEDAFEKLMAAIDAEQARRQHRFDWIVISFCWALSGTAIYGILTETIGFITTTAMLCASIAMLAGITPSLIRRRFH